MVWLPQVEKLLARLSDRVSELTEVTAQGDVSALCAQLLVRLLLQPLSWHGLIMCPWHSLLPGTAFPFFGCLAEDWGPGLLPACIWSF